jgi:hypothetical protein
LELAVSLYLEVLQHLLVQNLPICKKELHISCDDEMTIQVNQFDGKMNKPLLPSDEEDSWEMDMEKVCKSSDISQKHSLILSLQHLVKK